TYHNIFRVGKIMMDLGYWVLNSVVWEKLNPMPQFRGVRFTNSHEILIWARKSKDQKRYTFNYEAMKNLNEDKQMRSDWHLPLCTGSERIKVDGEKAHTTQKPEALLYRVILSSSNPGDVVLDPFFGTGTTGAVAKRLHRRWLGIERDPAYVKVAQERIDAVVVAQDESPFSTRSKRQAPRIPFGNLLEAGLLQPGDTLYLDRTKAAAQVQADGTLRSGDTTGSIHRLGAHLLGLPALNGWEHWYYRDAESGELRQIDELREKVRRSET
ncbi:MAG TPA: site-specific DNA-methyltransferase, partial [Chloroflexia bacterium]|nr:site-specific DNA-methyltransferase [Chloroflexia bacterium]